MSVTSKSPRKVAAWALQMGTEALPLYCHKFAPKTYTQPQLFACLALKVFFGCDYRGTEALLRDLPDLCQVIGLARVPDHATLHRAAKRLLVSRRAERLLRRVIARVMKRRRTIRHAAADSSGFEATNASRYFAMRRVYGKDPKNRVVYRTYGKLGLIIDTTNHLILSLQARRGPRPDVDELRHLIDHVPRRLSVKHLVADAGYDSEANHRYLREQHRIRSTIPPKHGRPTTALPAGRYRRLMKQRFNKHAYRHRAQVETVFSMIKRNLGATLTSRSYHARRREMILKALTHNLMILLHYNTFATEPSRPLFCLPLFCPLFCPRRKPGSLRLTSYGILLRGVVTVP